MLFRSNYLAIAALSNEGVPIDPFPFRTQVPEREWDAGTAQRARDRSREQWARPVPEIEREFAGRWEHVAGSFGAQAARRRGEADDSWPWGSSED